MEKMVSILDCGKGFICGVVVASLMSISSVSAEKPTPGFNHKIPESILTPSLVKTSIGTLQFYDGLPNKRTVTKVFDYLTTARAVEVFLNAMPAASMEAVLLGNQKMGVTACNKVLIFDDLMDSAPLFLTGNTDTVYASAVLNLKRDGATIVEVPPGCGPGTVNDAYFRFVTDMGSVGPDRGKGGLYLILPPDYEGDLEYKEGSATVEMMVGGAKKQVFVSKSPSYMHWLILRGMLVDGKPDAAAKSFRDGIKIYPLSKAGNQPPMEFINGSAKPFNTIHSNDYHFFEELNDVVQREHIDLFSADLKGLMSAIGIQKGKDFSPDRHMKELLVDGANIGNATARSTVFRGQMPGYYFWEGRHWKNGFIGGDYKWSKDKGLGGTYFDARTAFFYVATVNTPAMAMKFVGAGSQYAFCNEDKDGNYLYGHKNYKLNIPANVPVKDFWSIVVYDTQTRSELQTSQPFPSKNSEKGELVQNPDGSTDLYFGPKPPAGKESNWIETVPDKGWCTLLRLYGPLDPWFDNEWMPGEIELID